LGGTWLVFLSKLEINSLNKNGEINLST